MPTYQFRCPDGTIVERIFKISEVPESIPAPNGEGVAVRLISGGAGLIFKGSGFYITDYGKDGKKDQREAKEAKETKTPSTAGSETAKPAAESAAAPKPSSNTTSTSTGGTE